MLMVLTENGWVKDKNRSRRGKIEIVKPKIENDVKFVNIENIGRYVTKVNSNKGKLYSSLPIGIALATVSVSTGASGGVFWDAFLKYIFPWLIDIAKVFCAIKIAQAFYQERRGGRDEGSGFGAMVSYGKWLLIFHLLPWGVELIDQMGDKMWTELKETKLR